MININTHIIYNMYKYVALKSKATHIFYFFYFDEHEMTFEPEKRKKESFLWTLAVEHKLFCLVSWVWPSKQNISWIRSHGYTKYLQVHSCRYNGLLLESLQKTKQEINNVLHSFCQVLRD